MDSEPSGSILFPDHFDLFEFDGGESHILQAHVLAATAHCTPLVHQELLQATLCRRRRLSEAACDWPETIATFIHLINVIRRSWLSEVNVRISSPLKDEGQGETRSDRKWGMIYFGEKGLGIFEKGEVKCHG